MKLDALTSASSAIPSFLQRAARAVATGPTERSSRKTRGRSGAIWRLVVEAVLCMMSLTLRRPVSPSCPVSYSPVVPATSPSRSCPRFPLVSLLTCSLSPSLLPLPLSLPPLPSLFSLSPTTLFSPPFSLSSFSLLSSLSPLLSSSLPVSSASLHKVVSGFEVERAGADAGGGDATRSGYQQR